MLRFVAGFVSATLLWGGFVYAYSQGLIDISLEPDAPPELAAAETEAAPEAADKGKRPRRKKSGARSSKDDTRDPARLTGESTSGDDLGEDDARELNAGALGGEEQLRGTEIEKGFDSVFPQVRRCLILAAGNDPVQGKVVFGLRISGTGKVKAVNLKGPSAATQGESGACLRKAASSIQFRAFNGPDMVVHYPLTLQ